MTAPRQLKPVACERRTPQPGSHLVCTSCSSRRSSHSLSAALSALRGQQARQAGSSLTSSQRSAASTSLPLPGPAEEQPAPGPRPQTPSRRSAAAAGPAQGQPGIWPAGVELPAAAGDHSAAPQAHGRLQACSAAPACRSGMAGYPELEARPQVDCSRPSTLGLALKRARQDAGGGRELPGRRAPLCGRRRIL